LVLYGGLFGLGADLKGSAGLYFGRIMLVFVV
jgi:hypothetical protein